MSNTRASGSSNIMKMWGDEKYVEIGRKAMINIQTVGTSPLLKRAIREGGQVFQTVVDGGVEEKEETFLNHIDKLGGRLLYRNITASKKSSVRLWAFENGMIELNTSKNYIHVSVMSLSEEFVVNQRKFFSKYIVPPKTQGSVYAIIYSGGRLSMSNLGNAGVPLVEKNYTDKVMADYKYVIEDLNSSYPSGRLCIMEGVPGTGKTHLVRAMLNEVEKGMFVLVPPDMVKNLGGPELLPLLMQYHNYHSGPIILILEDADKCLITRANGEADTSVIQSILNLGDGIMGSMLDIRIIATTNAKKFEMDAAVLRRGRLSRQIQVGPLDEKSAIRAFKNLLPNMDPLPAAFLGQIADSPNKEIPLSDVYGIARDNGWRPKVVETDLMADDDDDEYDLSEDDDSCSSDDDE